MSAPPERIVAIIEHFGPSNALLGCREIVALLKVRPDLPAINRAV